MFAAINKFLWRKTARLFPAELDVIVAALPRDDSRTTALLRQARNAPWIERRKMNDSSFVVSIPYVKDSGDLIECTHDVESPALVVSDTITGREISFTLRITRGGFLGPLMGRMLDAGPFPKHWKAHDVRPLETNWLPATLTTAQKESRRVLLLEWLNMRLSARGAELIEVRQPAIEEEIADVQRRLGVLLPPDYVELLKISNGLTIGQLTVGGTYDLVLTDLHGGEKVIIITYLSADAVLFVSADSSQSSIFLMSPDSPEGHEYADGAKDLVRKVLAEASEAIEGR